MSMKAVYLEKTGPPENLIFGDLPSPKPGGSQVLVKVKAVSVNPIDTYLRSGAVPAVLPKPFIVGCDFAGEVVESGPTAIGFRRGDRVWGTCQGLLGRQGTFAEFAAVEEHFLYPLPPNVSFEDGAAVALVGITAHLGLFRTAQLRRGETLFVNGGSGGVGSMVVQMARLAGAQVITTAGSDEKVALCRELGAQHVLNYKKQDVAAELKKLAPDGVQVWWETQREPDFDKAVAALAPRGRMVVMAGRDARPPLPVGPFYVKSLTLHGFAVMQATPAELRECAADITEWLAAGKLKPRIDRVLPLAEAAAAHKLQEDNTLRKAGTLVGKIVLRV